MIVLYIVEKMGIVLKYDSLSLRYQRVLIWFIDWVSLDIYNNVVLRDNYIIFVQLGNLFDRKYYLYYIGREKIVFIIIGFCVGVV